MGVLDQKRPILSVDFSASGEFEERTLTLI